MVEIIAEVAQGYEGDLKLALLLAKASVKANADAIKYQLVFADELATPDYKYYDLFKSLEMDETVWEKVVDYIRKAKKKIYFDIYGEKGFNLAKALSADGIKLSTTEFYNDYLVQKVLAHFPKVLIGIGGISIEEIIEFIKKHHLKPSPDFCFLYGVQNLPTLLEDNHILRIKYLKEKFPEFNFGFMDHTHGDSEDALIVPLLTIPLGVKAIEKHITLDRLLEIEDYISALPPERFAIFVENVRKFEKVLGYCDMILTEKERGYKQRTAKVVVAQRDIKAGTSLTFEHLALKRVGVPLEENQGCKSFSDVVNRVLKVDVKQNEPILNKILGG